MYSCQFKKNFHLLKIGSHLEFSNFCQKWQNNKFATLSLTMRDRAISSKFSIYRVSEKCTLGNFQKIFLFPRMAAILNFRIFVKNGKKNKFASISLTVRDRTISSKFSTHRVCKQCTLGNFKKKIFLFPKVAAILNFKKKIEKQIFASISLTVQDRAILSKFLTQPMQKGMKLK